MLLCYHFYLIQVALNVYHGFYNDILFLFFQLVNNPLASQAAAAAAAAAMGSIANSQAFGNALSSLQGVTGQLVTNAQGQVSRRWSKQWILMAGWSWDKNEFRLYDSNLKAHMLKINKYWFARQAKNGKSEKQGEVRHS